MRTVKMILSAVLMLSSIAALSFAATNNFVYSAGSRIIGDQTTVGSVDVNVPDNIRAWFKAAGVDPATIDASLGSLSQSQKSAIDTVITDNLDTVTALVMPELKKALVRGEIENAEMRIGHRVWHLSIYGDEDR